MRATIDRRACLRFLILWCGLVTLWRGLIAVLEFAVLGFEFDGSCCARFRLVCGGSFGLRFAGGG